MEAPKLTSSPFRQSAIDRLSSPEQLDQLVKVSDVKGWVAAFGILLLVGFAVLWSVFGRIPTEVQAPGIVVLRGGQLMTVKSPANGQIAEMRVRAGDMVQAGQVIATLQQTDLEQQLADAREVLRERTNTLTMRQTALGSEMAERRQIAEERRLVLQQSIDAASQRIGRLQHILTIRQALVSAKLELEDRLEETRVELARADEEASDARAKLLEVDASLQESVISQQKELDSLNQNVSEAQRNVGLLAARLTKAKDVFAPASGRVTEVTSSAGATVDSGAVILNIETRGEGLMATVYIPMSSGKRVQPGMPAHIEPSTVMREEFGMLLGTVLDVSSYPSTPAGMLEVLQNKRLVESFGGSAPPYEARVMLHPANTPTGYAWTSGTGPRIDLTSGTTVKTYISVRSDPPIVLLLPFLRPLFAAS